MPLVRNSLATVAGLFVGGVVIAAVELVGHVFLDAHGVFIAAVVGYGVGASAGSAVAARFAQPLYAAFVVAALAVLAAVNLFAFPHPPWFAPAALLSLALGWVVGVGITGGPSRGNGSSNE